MAMFPYDITNLLGGRVRVLWAPMTVAAPAGPKDIFAQTAPYASATGWTDFGAGRDASSYERGIDLTGWEIQQAEGSVVEQVANVTRRVTVSMAELNDNAFSMFEQASAVSTVAAATGVSAQKKVPMGLIASLNRYRIAFVSQRDATAGLVHEVALDNGRGRFVVGCGYSASITADAVSLEQAKAAMSAVTVNFNFYPAGATAGEEFGAWFLEQAGTLT